MARKITNSTYVAGKSRATLDHWVGPMQHSADGASTDPKSRPPQAGPERSTPQPNKNA